MQDHRRTVVRVRVRLNFQSPLVVLTQVSLDRSNAYVIANFTQPSSGWSARKPRYYKIALRGGAIDLGEPNRLTKVGFKLRTAFLQPLL